MGSDTTPGGIATFRCPHCGGSVFFIIKGGPKSLPCPHCNRSIALDVVHDGRKWTVRRLRKGGETIPAP